jgi:hypothetical protein
VAEPIAGQVREIHGAGVATISVPTVAADAATGAAGTTSARTLTRTVAARTKKVRGRWITRNASGDRRDPLEMGYG